MTTAGERAIAGSDGGLGDVRIAGRRFDASGLLVSAGLIDLQINGAAGHDLTTEPEALWSVGAALPRYGVTAFLPTLVSPSLAIVDRARAAFVAGPPAGYLGATPLGWHVEGPFLAPSRAGAHDPATLRAPDPDAIAGWAPDAGVRMVTLAPELPGALDLVRTLVSRGVIVSIGHTEATREEAQAAFDAGARFVTHLFNAMPKPAPGTAPDPEDLPGLAVAALHDPRVTIGIIPDGLHVEPALVGVVRRAIEPDRLAIVTDAIAALGMPPGRYQLAARDCFVDETSARLAGGGLAGSVLAMDQGVRNLAAFAGLAPVDALVAATSAPARLLGLELPARGELLADPAGDVVLFDANLAPVLTIVGGRVAFDAADPARWS